MSRWVPFLAVLCFALGLESSGATVSSVPKPSRGSWVVDTTRTLDATTRAEVNRLGAEAHSSGQGQLVVVVVDTTKKVPARTFAQKLFNTWGIGKAGRDDGALLFIALKDRKAEILLGDGLSAPEDLSRSKALMSDHIIPAFKRGKPKEAVVEGAKGLRELLALSPLNARTSDVEAPPVQEAPQPTVAAQPQVAAQPAVVRDAPVEDEEEKGPGVLNWVLFGAGAFGLGWVLRGWWSPRKSKRRGGHSDVELSLGSGEDHPHDHREPGDSHEHRDERDHARTHHPDSERSGVATAVAVGATAVAVASVIEASSSSDSSSSSWDSSSSSSDSSSSWDSSSSSSSSSDFGGGDSSSGGGSSGEW